MQCFAPRKVLPDSLPTVIEVILPALNEAGSIAQTVTEIHQHAAGFDVLVVDDGSVDDTAAIDGR